MNDADKVIFLLSCLDQIRSNLKLTYMPPNEKNEFVDIITWMIKKVEENG